jgi:hypothetical protein
MVFSGHPGYPPPVPIDLQRRYATWDEAMNGHKLIVCRLAYELGLRKGEEMRRAGDDTLSFAE